MGPRDEKGRIRAEEIVVESVPNGSQMAVSNDDKGVRQGGSHRRLLISSWFLGAVPGMCCCPCRTCF